MFHLRLLMLSALLALATSPLYSAKTPTKDDTKIRSSFDCHSTKVFEFPVQLSYPFVCQQIYRKGNIKVTGTIYDSDTSIVAEHEARNFKYDELFKRFRKMEFVQCNNGECTSKGAKNAFFKLHKEYLKQEKRELKQRQLQELCSRDTDKGFFKNTKCFLWLAMQEKKWPEKK